MDVRSRPPGSHPQVLPLSPGRRPRFVVAALACTLIVAGCSSSDAAVKTTTSLASTPTTTPGSGVAAVTVAPTVPSATAATLPASTVATTPAATTTGAKVVVANASTVDGAAGRFTEALQAKKFDVAKPINATNKVSTTKVYYDPADAAALPVATYLASVVGGVTAEVLPAPVPVKDGKLPDGVTVLLLLGSDKADKPLGTDTAATTTIAGAAGSTSTTAAP